MDEKILEEIQFHQDVVAKDANSPLFQIREKEMEIHGRILAAKSEAESILSEARQKAQEAVQNADSAADKLAKEHAETLLAEAEAAVAGVHSQGESDTVDLKKALTERQLEAVDFVVKLVTSV